MDHPDLAALRRELTPLAKGLGFAAVGVSDLTLKEDETHLIRWLQQGFHGEMQYMERHGHLRAHPAEWVPGAIRVISVRMDYWPAEAYPAQAILDDPERAYVSRYALGRDYHKVLRRALRRLGEALAERIGPFGYRVCVDSAPVLEKAVARKAGLGWIGKHTNLIHSSEGSWFFLGELLTDLPLPIDVPASAHCGTCEACLPACPTGAIVAPWQLDARRCISYLTIELKGAIPIELRPLIGNRIYGCDDCQLVCPWNKFARDASHPDFRMPRHHLDRASLCELFLWTEEDFLLRTEGSAIRRIGYQRWLRNLAVALGNGPPTDDALAALNTRVQHPSALVREHVTWALETLAKRKLEHASSA
jgi:epoxyqueuosine reductase